MVRFLSVILAAAIAYGADALYEIDGRISPANGASVAVHAVSSPFKTQALANSAGRFRLKKLPPGAYSIMVWMPGRGEARRTIEVGPAQADARRKIALHLEFRDSDFEFNDSSRRLHSVSASQLAVPGKAVREYEKAQSDFAKGNFESGLRRMQRAVEIAPQFAAAWNDLGTIAYKNREFARAEECFRRSLDADPTSYFPLVNLGGTLISMGRFKESLAYNLRAVQARPGDALANSQLGQSYFTLGQLDSAAKYLEEAVRLDPAHFSHPQLFLAEIQVRRGERSQAVENISNFLKLHPDYARAGELRKLIEKLQK